MPDDATAIRRPKPQRPRIGWAAWEATVGYLATQYSPDAALKLEITAGDNETVNYSASVTWGHHREVVRENPSLPLALRNLWRVVNYNHVVFKTDEAAVKRPQDYGDDQWLDDRTQETLDRLIRVTRSVFEVDWKVIVIYQPVDNPVMRLQVRLLARHNTMLKGGRGPTLLVACRDLYNNAAQLYATASRREGDDSPTYPKPESRGDL